MQEYLYMQMFWWCSKVHSFCLSCKNKEACFLSKKKVQKYAKQYACLKTWNYFSDYCEEVLRKKTSRKKEPISAVLNHLPVFTWKINKNCMFIKAITTVMVIITKRRQLVKKIVEVNCDHIKKWWWWIELIVKFHYTHFFSFLLYKSSAIASSLFIISYFNFFVSKFYSRHKCHLRKSNL